ncbi:hypothetical protein LFL96_19045 [Paraburkholderia sp. D15]|uniref:DUF6708 domain-containing protein n=1 Tax=Paraburkholderia sp. D15 TaxID=2880218 RepID=UPI00247B28C5|nr:DUF6708 domain-containing protein [Paraburkholderia sp. D15]WGS49819.1 hypothetical protein LFL96_19045 [Paraburkholderia sp. D15]
MKIRGIARSITEDEFAARLEQKNKCTDNAKSSGTAFECTDNYLEVCDGLYREKGWGLLAFLMGGIPAIGSTIMALWIAINTSPALRQKGLAELTHWVFGFFALLSFGVFLWASRFLFVDCFNYTSKPIRFNRIDRTIYVFKHNGPGGVVSVPWDQAFLYVERSPRGGLLLTAGRVARCLVLDEKGQVTDSIPIGKRVVLASPETGPLGQQVMNELYEDFEYYRRFMEEGPALLPRVESFLSKKVSFRNSLKLRFEDEAALLKSGNLFLIAFGIVALVPVFIFSCANYLAMRTCREPVWPDDVERACGALPNAISESVAT